MLTDQRILGNPYLNKDADLGAFNDGRRKGCSEDHEQNRGNSYNRRRRITTLRNMSDEMIDHQFAQALTDEQNNKLLPGSPIVFYHSNTVPPHKVNSLGQITTSGKIIPPSSLIEYIYEIARTHHAANHRGADRSELGADTMYTYEFAAVEVGEKDYLPLAGCLYTELSKPDTKAPSVFFTFRNFIVTDPETTTNKDVAIMTKSLSEFYLLCKRAANEIVQEKIKLCEPRSIEQGESYYFPVEDLTDTNQPLIDLASTMLKVNVTKANGLTMTLRTVPNELLPHELRSTLLSAMKHSLNTSESGLEEMRFLGIGIEGAEELPVAIVGRRRVDSCKDQLRESIVIDPRVPEEFRSNDDLLTGILNAVLDLYKIKEI